MRCIRPYSSQQPSSCLRHTRGCCPAAVLAGKNLSADESCPTRGPVASFPGRRNCTSTLSRARGGPAPLSAFGPPTPPAYAQTVPGSRGRWRCRRRRCGPGCRGDDLPAGSAARLSGGSECHVPSAQRRSREGGWRGAGNSAEPDPATDRPPLWALRRASRFPAAARKATTSCGYKKIPQDIELDWNHSLILLFLLMVQD